MVSIAFYKSKTMSARPSWDEYFLNITEQIATRSTCDRAHVGAVITKENRILACGYNGSPKSAPHCDDVGHEMVNNHCVRTVHAEINAIIDAGLKGVSIVGATLYCSISPCYDCAKALVNAQIKRVVYKKFYEGRYGASTKATELLRDASITVDHIKE